MADIRTELRDLVTLWLRVADRVPHPSGIPRELLATVTRREPYRAAVLRDATGLLGEPTPLDERAEIHLDARLLVAPHDGWTCAIQPFRFRVVRDGEQRRERWHCVALEDDRWRLVALRPPDR